jgi:hypothetical protein
MHQSGIYWNIWVEHIHTEVVISSNRFQLNVDIVIGSVNIFNVFLILR